MFKSLRGMGLILAVMLILVLAVVPAYAQSGGNQQFMAGRAGMNNWQTLAPGQSVEWRFHYLGGSDSPTGTIELAMDPANSVRFDVFTEQQWVSASTDHVGAGTVQTRSDKNGKDVIQNNGDLFWQVSTPDGQTFHIQVVNTTQQTVRYWINSSGAGNGGLAMYSAPMAPANRPQLALASPATRGAPTASGGGAAPLTLPVTGGSELSLLLGAGLTLIAGGWLARRRTN